ncbi:FAD-dependent oxidoreductase [Haloactinomyces albus]|uniref:Assimilatory nitrate reductase electron transfer subunit n=1 Tax=Haloactinomyces albus TaxID=1352928 RepID=A0AAE4CPH4_9ACTN|nr:FAD-dependent oxidoreductase [Haloactinomyces albus]MDR7304421.1 assimilatory nitrate reductase electron transfer subunit [Haloactinomyces albus]
MNDLVIVGHGPGAHRLIDQLLRQGYAGRITVLDAESRPTYNRMLLTSVLEGNLGTESLTLPRHPDAVRVWQGVTVTGIDRHRRLVRTDTGQEHRYDTLVLATGARPHLPEVPGLHDSEGFLVENVTPLRTLDDGAHLARLAESSGRITVLGGGVLGVETATALNARGLAVTLVHAGKHLMDRRLDPAAGRMLAEALSGRGIGVRLSGHPREYRPGALTLDDGQEVAAEAVAVCTGVLPETTLARQAGLAVHRGVVVDDQLRTTDERIHALGDCAEHDGLPTESSGAGRCQADVLAQVLSGASPEAHYPGTRNITRLKACGIDLVTLGPAEELNSGDDAEAVTLSDPARGRYARLSLHNDRIAAAVVLGLPTAVATMSQLHSAGRPVPADRLAALLGTTPARHTGSGELPDSAVLCRCNNVTRKALATAFGDGARDVPALARATRATTGCGSCTDTIRRLCRSLADTIPEQEDAA